MNIHEMDIELQTQLHQVASNAYLGLQPEERMLMLNNGQLQFVHSIVNPLRDPKRLGYAGTRFRLDELEALITKSILPVYEQDTNSVYGNLPSNYLHGLDVSASTGCDTANVTFQEQGYNIIKVPLPTASIMSNWVITLNTTAGPVVAFTMTNYLAAGFDSRFNGQLIPLVLRKLKHPALTLYWERFGDVYEPNHFLFIWTGATPGLVSVSTVLDGGAPVIYSGDTPVRKVSTVVGATALVPCRTIDASVIEQNVNPFTKSKQHNPLATYSSGKIEVYHFNTFTVKDIQLRYVRKPLELSLTLNQSCELGSTYGTKTDICRHIIAETVRMITGLTGNPQYQIAAAESQLTS